MNRIKQLIKELCPNGVGKVMLLDALSQPVTDGPHETPKLQDFGVPFLSVESVTGREIDITKKRGYISNEYNIQISKKYFPKTGDVYIVKSASIGKVAIVGTETNFNIWSPLAAMRPDPLKLNSRFLFYLLQTEEIQKEVRIKSGTGSQPNLSMRTLEKFEIPLPPLPIQTEIVRILDKFVEQQEQLERLIELRKKQYEYYREEMLKPKEGEVWERKTIGELGTITRGRRFVRDDVRESGMPCIHYGDMYTYYGITARTTKTFLDRNFPKKMQYAKKGDVVVVGAGENDLDIGVGMVWEGDEPAAVHDACYILTHNQNSKYIAYFLRTNNYHQQLRKYVSDGKICSISGKGLGSCIISIPSLTKQQEIVEFLDKFEFSITALTSALELSKRRYEYYRDKMMRF